ncbi:MAG: tetratricopeptide repeat protein [Gemmatimonadota bacterium]|nr:tetratricopeptide repeat protein [Gemmatimonadota bacterium]
MADARPAARAATGAPTWEFVSTFLILLASLVALFVLDVALARIDKREQKSNAADLYAEGTVLLRGGKPAQATDRFVSAVAMERGNHDYELALAEAMLADNRVDDARATLTRLLSRAETDGAVNIAMARTLVRARDPEAAKSYYHRAVYGRWRGDTAALRMSARLELIALLAKRGESRELLAELLPLEDVYQDSASFRRALAQDFLRAESPSRALEIYRSLTTNNRRDAVAWAGSGEASLALGNFRDALRNLDEAHRLAPGDARTAALLLEADSSRAMNPEERGLGAHRRFVRARALLARTVAVLERCNASRATPADSVRSAQVQLQLTAKVRAAAEETAGNAIIAEATDLWAARPLTCKAGDSAGDQALVHVFAFLAQ